MLTRYISASQELEDTAERYAQAVITEARRNFKAYCVGEILAKADAADDPVELVHEFTDSMQTVFITVRARALVMGCGGYAAVLEDYETEFGRFEPGAPDVEVLAYFLIARELYEIANELEAVS